MQRGNTRDTFERLRRELVSCKRCPRLVAFRESIPPRASFRGQEYWRKPVPSFGDPDAWLLVLGLAPAAHGGNRTGRIFTGDRSAAFLMKVMWEAGLANRPTSVSRDDGLELHGCYVSAVLKCVPPGDRPTPEELRNCRPFLQREIDLLPNLRAVVALGQLAFKAYLDAARLRWRHTGKTPAFAHGARFVFDEGPRLYASYHPSPRNTNTGKLTEKMLLSVFEEARSDDRKIQNPQTSK
ncbi:MAG TPA: uracil-DNA glycosylase [Nitrososphaerales archaeon]|nr:uracil-DNA glycosylase [Nitrososphaerales archaeon]